MYTFLMTYPLELDGYGEISFCAETLDEAMTLFSSWCREQGMEPPVFSADVVYDPVDAGLYAETYGTPEDYREQQLREEAVSHGA